MGPGCSLLRNHSGMPISFNLGESVVDWIQEMLILFRLRDWRKFRLTSPNKLFIACLAYAMLMHWQPEVVEPVWKRIERLTYNIPNVQS